jgi:hypothetical protein
MFEQSFSLCVFNDLKQPVEPIENEASDVKQEMNAPFQSELGGKA